MIKIITALGNPNLNSELRKYDEFEVIGKDIQYKDGILETLEINSDVNYLIISEMLDGNISFDKLVDLIIKLNRKIKIIAVLKEKDSEMEEMFIKNGIYDFVYDNTEFSEIINLLKTKNIEYLNRELREEIEQLKRIVNKNKYKKIRFKDLHINKNKFINKECKTIGIVGNRGSGKSTFINIISNILEKKYKILIIDFNIINGNMEYFYKRIFKQKKYKIIEKDFDNGKDIIKLRNNINIILGLNKLYNNKLDVNNFFEKINRVKENYDFIFIDTYSEILFKENELILNKCDNIFFISQINGLELEKAKILLNTMKEKWKINNSKIKIIFNKNTLINYIIKKKYNIKNKINNIEIIGSLNNYYFIDLYLYNKIFYKIINYEVYFKIKKIIKKINN